MGVGSSTGGCKTGAGANSGPRSVGSAGSDETQDAAPTQRAKQMLEYVSPSEHLTGLWTVEQKHGPPSLTGSRPTTGADGVPRPVGLKSFSGVVLEKSTTYVSGVSVYRLQRGRQAIALTGIEAASGTKTASRSSEETPPEPYEESAKAEQPRPTTTVRKTHSSFVEQNLPKRRPERVEVGSVSSTAPWTVRRGLVAMQGR